MDHPGETTALALGFLTVVRDANGYLGGYLITNRWGRPLEFRMTTAVQPNKVQQVLYGDTLERYLCSDLIGKALFDKTATRVNLLLTDTEAALDLRRHVAVPVAWLPKGAPKAGELVAHQDYPDDGRHASAVAETLDTMFELAEPFSRIREAINEARKMGVTSRAA